MGVYVHLRVRHDAIDPAAWNEAYDETLRLLRAHPSQILGLDRRKLLGRDVVMYTRELERKVNGSTEWCAVGDRRSMRFGESFHFQRDDSAEPDRAPRKTKSKQRGRVEDDIVFAEPDEREGSEVFGNKTQGEPYHLPILAAAMAVEARFPRAALVYGDIDEDEVHEAKAWAEDALNRTIAQPVLFDARALLDRLSTKWRGAELFDAFARRFCGEASRGLSHVFRTSSRSAGEAYLREIFSRSKAQEDAYGAPSSESVARGFLLGGGSLARLFAIAAEPRTRKVLSETALASLLAHTGMLFDPAVSARVDRCNAIGVSARPDVSLVQYYLGAVFLHNKEWGGLRIDPGEIETALAEACPKRASALLSHIQDETRKLQELVVQMCEAMESAARFVDEIGSFQGIGELVSVRSPAELVAGSRERLSGFAYALHETLRKARRKPPVTGDDIDAARSFFVAAAAHPPRLTEDAWAWILREEEPPVLRLLGDLFCCEPQSDDAWTLKRALLENRVLCEVVIQMLDDSAQMAAAGARARRAALQEAARRRKSLQA